MRTASRLRKSRTSLQRRSGWIGVSSLDITLSCSAVFSASITRSLLTQSPYWPGLILPLASARSCSSTARASPRIGTSTSRLWPRSDPPRWHLEGRRPLDLVLVDLLAERVAGHVDVDGPQAAGHGLAIRGREDLGNALGVVDPLGPLGDGLEHRELIDLLKRLAAVV